MAILTQGVKAAGLINFGAIATFVAGLSVWNFFRAPDTQTIQGIDNKTIMVVSIAAVVGLWLVQRKKR